MISDLNKEIKKEALIEKLKSFSIPVTVAGGILFFVIILSPFVTESTTQIKGIAFQLSTSQTLEGNKPVMVVKLENGKLIRARMLKSQPFRKGASVQLLVKKSLNNRLSYDLLKYNE